MPVAEALRRAIERTGLTTRGAERPPFGHRFVVVDTSGQECIVEVFADGGRLHPRVTLDIGPVLHPDDLAADKLLPCGGEPDPATSTTYTPSCTATATTDCSRSPQRKTPASRPTFLDALNAINRLTPEDWAEDGIDGASIGHLRSTFADWHKQLAAKNRG